MDSKKAEELLNKYWSCETSLEEEQQLREFFQHADNIPEHWRETAPLFQYFAENKKKAIDDKSFEKDVVRRLTRSASGNIRSLVVNTMRIAAGIAVLVAAIWFVHQEMRSTTPPEIADTYDDPKLAFEETKKALLMISKSFSTAKEQAKKINLLNEAKEEIQKQNDKKNL